jgi:hypothetical protein
MESEHHEEPPYFKVKLAGGPPDKLKKWGQVFEKEINRRLASDEEFKEIIRRTSKIVAEEVLYGGSENEAHDCIRVANLMRALHVAIEANKANGLADSAETRGWQNNLDALNQGRYLEIRKEPR